MSVRITKVRYLALILPPSHGSNIFHFTGGVGHSCYMLEWRICPVLITLVSCPSAPDGTHERNVNIEHLSPPQMSKWAPVIHGNTAICWQQSDRPPAPVTLHLDLVDLGPMHRSSPVASSDTSPQSSDGVPTIYLPAPSVGSSAHRGRSSRTSSSYSTNTGDSPGAYKPFSAA